MQPRPFRVLFSSSPFLSVKPPLLFLLPFFLASVVQDQRWCLRPLQRHDRRVFPSYWKWKFRLSSRLFAAGERKHLLAFSLSLDPLSLSRRREFGSFSSSVTSAEASECPRLEIRPSCRLGGDESIRRPDCWGSPERPRWQPEDRGHIQVRKSQGGLQLVCMFMPFGFRSFIANNAHHRPLVISFSY